MTTRTKRPGGVRGNPELDWMSIDDMIWLAWMDRDGVPVGEMPEAQAMLRSNLLECHNDPRDGKQKPHGVGWIDVTTGTKHKIEKLDPLTISPSILCAQGCGFHGFVREGHWVPT